MAVKYSETLDYDGETHQLTLTRGDGTVQSFPAANNAQRRSGGRWPDGTYHYERHTTHPDDAPDSGYGSHGNYIFTVPGRDKMGVHSGRADRRDGAGRSGVNHATLGCIRTTDEGTAAIRDAVTSGDPVTRITVRNNR
ncbi:MAG TPA: L,D-transpeptidase [Rhizomicrobium sp.]|nr:L,D-transpeptidase [Rhizomicrobium sp.]